MSIILFLSQNIELGLWYSMDHMVVGFTTTCTISAYHHYSCEFECHLWRGVLDTTLCDQIRQ
jgi:hypothetical protein